MLSSSFTIPNYIYNSEDFHKNIKFGHTTENVVLDFKQELDLSIKKDKSKKAQELALDICQFSNTWGGVLLIGISEDFCDKSNAKVASKVNDYGHYEELSQFVNDKVIPIIHPVPNIDITPIKIDSALIIAINIRPLEESISCVYSLSPPFSSRYPYRTHHGKKYLRPHDVEKILSMNNRSLIIRFNELTEKTREVIIYPSLLKDEIEPSRWDNSNESIIVENISSGQYTLNIAGIRKNIPYSFTKDIWLTEDFRIGISLNIKLKLSSDRKKVEFEM